MDDRPNERLPERLPEHPPGFEGFGVRRTRQSVTMSLHGVSRALPSVPIPTLDFAPGELLPHGELGALRVIEVVRHDRIGGDGEIERYWVLKVESL